MYHFLECVLLVVGVVFVFFLFLCSLLSSHFRRFVCALSPMNLVRRLGLFTWRSMFVLCWVCLAFCFLRFYVLSSWTLSCLDVCLNPHEPSKAIELIPRVLCSCICIDDVVQSLTALACLDCVLIQIVVFACCLPSDHTFGVSKRGVCCLSLELCLWLLFLCSLLFSHFRRFVCA